MKEKIGFSYRPMTIEEEEKHEKITGLKAPYKMMMAGEFIGHEYRKEFMVKEEE